MVNEGQEIPVKLTEIDKMGRLNLSYIDAIDPDGQSEESPNREGGRSGSGYRDSRPRNDRYKDERNRRH